MDDVQTTLQSLNQELQTVNHELAIKVDELDRANADLRNVLESTQIATVFLDRFMVIRGYTPAVDAIFNLIQSDIGKSITAIEHRIADIDLERDIRCVLGEHKTIERSVRFRDSKIYHLMRVLPYRAVNNEIDGALITFVDVTAAVLAEEKQRLLVSELNHRVRNMLQVVIGIANQTLHRASSLEEFEKTFIGRVQALSRAYRLLSRDGWHNAPLDELVATQLEPFAAEGARFEIQGEPVELTASAALALGLIVYELSTNAVKYGAFSQPSGQIDIHWKVEGKDGNGHLVLYWRERGGPRVHEPTRQGFGSKLIAGQLRHELQGEATVDFAADGLQLRLSIPVSRALVQETPGPA